MECKNADFPDTVRKLVHIKQEHEPILRRVVSDRGMDSGTREALVEHLLEEESGLVDRLASLAGANSAGNNLGATEAAPAVGQRPWTVGPLRGLNG